MRLVVQRVKSASVSVNGVETAAIGAGMLVLVGLAATDTPELADRAASKLLSVRLWDDKDANKPWARNVVQQGMELLLVSQFTLCGRLKGNKPDWSLAMHPTPARELWDGFVSKVGTAYPAKVHEGVFGAKMDVALVNDGPVTLTLDYDPPAAAAPE